MARVGSRSDWIKLRSDEMRDAATMAASSTYIGPGPLPKYRAGREPTTAGEFEGGQLVQAILTKGGLRLSKALVVTLSWAPR